jgi:hypothetical protein
MTRDLVNGSTSVNRGSTSVAFLAWNGGRARLFDGSRLRDLGLMQSKTLAQEWCEFHRVRFLDSLPIRW